MLNADTNLDELHIKIIRWADARNLFGEGGVTSTTQALKLVSEVGELTDSVIKGTDITDHIGDCFVVLAILAQLNKTSLNKCVSTAYDDIKDRKGVMCDGVFIKEHDEAYQAAVKRLTGT